jgi:hypothetical protein
MKRSNVRIVLTGWLASGGLVGCVLFTDLDDFSRIEPSSDASDVAVEAAVDDASAPALTPSEHVDAGATTYCEGALAPFDLCADFEDGKIPAIFVPFAVNGGSATVNATNRSLALSLYIPGNATNYPTASVSTAITPGDSAIVELDLLVQELGSVELDFLQLAGPKYRLGLELRGSGGLGFDERYPLPDGGVGARVTTVPLTAGATWRRLRFEAKVTGAAGTLRVYVDDTAVGGAFPFDREELTASDRLIVGENSINPQTTAWRIAIDNIVVRH